MSEAMTPDAPLSAEQIDKYEAAILNGQLMHGAPQIVYDLVQSHRALASERDELKYKMQVMADMVGEENWSLRNQLADAQARLYKEKPEWNNPDGKYRGLTWEDYAKELEQQHATLRERCERLEKANSLLMECSYQSHSGHWDRTGQSGAGCDECNRARRLREEAKALATGADIETARQKLEQGCTPEMVEYYKQQGVEGA